MPWLCLGYALDVLRICLGYALDVLRMRRVGWVGEKC